MKNRKSLDIYRPGLEGWGVDPEKLAPVFDQLCSRLGLHGPSLRKAVEEEPGKVPPPLLHILDYYNPQIPNRFAFGPPLDMNLH